MSTIDSNENRASASTSNFTPLNTEKLKAKKTHARLNMLLILVAIATAVILAFIMISLFKTS